MEVCSKGELLLQSWQTTHDFASVAAMMVWDEFGTFIKVIENIEWYYKIFRHEVVH